MIRTALFDKDGTLIDFHRTWDAAVGIALRGATSDAASLNRAAELLRFDLDSNTIGPGSALVADSNQQVIDLIRGSLDVARFATLLNSAAVSAAAPSVGAPQVLHDLLDLDIELVVVTNDFEAPTRQQMSQLGWTDLFSHFVGSDSGYGAKPDPGMISEALALCGVEPAEAESLADLIVPDLTELISTLRATTHFSPTR